MTTSKKHWFHCFVMFALMVGIGQVPPLGGDITPLGMKILGIFVGLLYGWGFLDFFWTSMTAILALGLTEYTTIAESFSSAFSAPLTLQIIFLLTLVGYLEDSGLPTLITGWFLTRKSLDGRPYLLFAAIFVCAGILMALGLNLGAVFIMWTIMYSIFDTVGVKKGDITVTYLLFGCVVFGVLGISITPFQMIPLLVIDIVKNTLGMEVSAVDWIVWSTLVFVVFLLAYLAYGKFILKVDTAKFIGTADLCAHLKGKKATLKMKIAGISMLCFVSLLILPSVLPKGWALTQFLAQFGVVGAVVLLMIVTTIIRIDDKPMTNWDLNAKNGIQWGVIGMFAATTPISTALESEQCGIISTLVTTLSPLVSNLGLWPFYIAVFFIFWIITQFAHNIVVAAVLTPFMVKFAVLVGANPCFLVAGICAVCQMAYLTPGASSAAAVFYSNKEWIPTNQAYKVAVQSCILGFICILLCVPVGHILF